jgi:phosphoserine phosphatase
MTQKTEFFIIDFDRTLADSDKLLEAFIEVTTEYIAIPREQIEAANRDVRQRGDSFDTAGYVRDHLNEMDRGEEWDTLEKEFIHRLRARLPELLLAGASELLEWLRARGSSYGILTYGNPLWQHMKLSATGFNHEQRIVMEHKHKGRLISSWQQSDGSFVLPQEFGGGVADAIVMLDDKAVSFEDFPAVPSRGYWICDPTHELPSQRGTVPANVQRCNTLSDALATLRR